MRAVGHALAAVFLLAGHVHFAPAGTGGQDHRLAAQGSAAGQLDLDQAIAGQFGRALLGDHVNVVLLDVLLQAGNQFRTLGVRHGNEVLDTHGIHYLAAETLGHQTGANALARSVDGCRGAGRATADDQHFVGSLLVQLGRLALGRTTVDLVDDLGQRHAALAEVFAVQEHGGHSHDLAALDFVLEQGAIDHHMGDVRVQGRHQVQRLYHVRAVLAGQRDIGLEVELALQVADLLQQCRISLGRVTTGLQQRQYQRGELVAHGDTGKADPRGFPGGGNTHARGALVGRVGQADLARHLGDLGGQLVQFLALGAVIDGHADFYRLYDILQVGVQLLLQIGI